ncbi:hypothetical protein K7X08_031261 [Anisodus acutangulus]|uniref:Uncharacterized protein n=1 Tax=Anisodus acutangulus TaxID=402998 RepID=A0A9Q1MM06_9SOLA|nr:hypothetical protein K7X08_031261 [Anisodus acutangulus]
MHSSRAGLSHIPLVVDEVAFAEMTSFETLKVVIFGRFCYCRTLGFTIEIDHLNLVASSSFTTLEKLKGF